MRDRNSCPPDIGHSDEAHPRPRVEALARCGHEGNATPGRDDLEQLLQRRGFGSHVRR